MTTVQTGFAGVVADQTAVLRVSAAANSLRHRGHPVRRPLQKRVRG